MHGWDLARATGQDETIDRAPRSSASSRFVERMGTSTMRENGVTGPEVAVPADAPDAGPDARPARTRPALITPATGGCAATSDWRGPTLQVAEAPAEAHERRRVLDVGGVGLEERDGELAEGDDVRRPPGGEELLDRVEDAVARRSPSRRAVGRAVGR